MDILISEMVAQTDSDQGVISLITKSASDGLSTVVRFRDENRENLSRQIGSQLLGWVSKNSVPLRIDDLDDDERFPGLDSNDGKYKHIICYPLIARNETIGLFILVRSDKKPPFEDRHCEMLGVLAPQSAQLLANAKLLEELSQTNELLEISRRRLKEENLKLKNEMGARFAFENIICKSQGMKRALSLVSKYCVSDSPVLITGETGTGKDLIARAIHFNSERKNKPFVVINCSLKTETLLESELFGHMKGSFTGAFRNKIGLFKEADGGTIFLDEIGDSSLSTQAAILRVIQNGEIRPIGSTKTETVNVRVISATNRNLDEQILAKSFREDLFYRLNTFAIELPPLRERRDDIPLLVNHFLNKMRIKISRDNISISAEALDILTKYRWPGNVRELESEIERAAVTCRSNGVIEPKDLSPRLLMPSDRETIQGEPLKELKALVESFERDIIKRALAENRGNVFQTSRVLGLTRTGLTNKIKRYKIVLDYNKIISD